MWISRGRLAALPRVALGLVLVVLVSGCSSGEGPRPSLPRAGHSGIARASASPSPTKSRSREDEVVEVVRQFFAALDKAAQTGNTDDIVAVTHPRGGCRKLVAYIGQEFSQGARDEGAHWIVIASTFFAFDRGTALVRVSYHVTAYRNIAANGGIRASYPAGTMSGLVRLAASAGHWLVSDLYTGETR